MISIDMSQIDFGSVCVGVLVCFVISNALNKVFAFALAVLCAFKNEPRHRVIENLMEKSRSKYEKLLPHWDVRTK